MTYHVTADTVWYNVNPNNGHELRDYARFCMTSLSAAGGPAFYHRWFDRQRELGFKPGDSAEALARRFAEFAKTMRLGFWLSNQYYNTDFEFIGSRGVVTIKGGGGADCHVISNHKEWYDAICEFFLTELTKTQTQGEVYIAASTASGLDFRVVGVGGQNIERANYSAKVLEGYDRIVRDLNSSAPAGRVAILNGKPGTGKSYLVRGLLNDAQNASCIILPAELVSQLTGPSFMPALLDFSSRGGRKGKSMVFFIEDADAVLATRMGDNIGSISTLLNLGDGIVGQLLDIRIVTTTNAAHTDIDPAILRPGRLSASVSVGALSYDEASTVYRRLRPDSDGLQTRQAYTLAEVYSLARADGWTAPPKAQAMGFSAPELELSGP